MGTTPSSNQAITFSQWFKGFSIRMKRFITFLLILSAILFISAIGVALSNPRTIALMDWNPIFYPILVFVGLFTCGLTGILFIDFKISQKRPPILKRPSKAFGVIAIIFTIFPGVLLGMQVLPQYMIWGDSEPQLIWVPNQSNPSGIPDVALTFTTQKATTFQIKWGTAQNNLINAIDEPNKVKTHVFLMTELQPSTTYYYQIVGKDTIYNFTTPSGESDTLHFGFTSDLHIAAGTNNKTATETIFKQFVNPTNDFDTFFLGGDYVEMGGYDSQWKEFTELLSPYSTQKPMSGAIGNHDGFLEGEYEYERYLSPSSINWSSESSLYRRLDFGNVHIFILDLEWGTETYTAAQKAWFEKEITSINPDDWTIVINHCMYYTSGIAVWGLGWWDQEPMIKTFEPIFKQYDVDLVLVGHNHHLEILENDGIVYAVAGGGGGHLDPEREVNGTGSVWYLDHQFGFADVNLNGSTGTITMRTPENDVLFTYNLTK